jgi:iron complex outermembrane receptor protein
LLDLLFSPRGSVIMKPTDHQSFRLTGATAFRAPTFIESYLDTESGSGVPGVTVLAKGDQNLRPERIISAEVGYANQESDYISLEVNAFYNIVKHQIQTNALSVARLADANPYNQDSQAFPIATQSSINEELTWHNVGGAAGFRLFPVDGLDIYANYSYTRVTARGPGSAVPGREKDDRTPDHKVNAGIQYRAPFRLELALDAHYVAKQRWAEDAVDPSAGFVYGIHDLPAYTLVNGRVGYELVQDHLDVGVNVLNILDARMRQHPFAQPGSRLAMAYAKLRW